MVERILYNAFCAAIILIIFLAIFLQRSSKDRISHKFTLLLFAIFAYLLFCIACELFERNVELNILATVFNILLFITVDVIVIAFTYYQQTLLESLNFKKFGIIKAIYILCFVRMALVIVLYFTNSLFYLDNKGVYQERNLVFIPYVFSALIMVIHIINLCICRKYFSTKQFVVMLLYLIIPVSPILIELFTGYYSLTSVALTLSVLLVYILIQVDVIQKSKDRESVLEEISTKDFLTELNNRRAFYNRICEVEKCESIGIVFCDINNLKYTNDHFGHNSGDELIKKFAGILIDCFQKDQIFRISGDEFIVIIPNITANNFSGKVEVFKSKVQKNDNISAIGSSHGSGSVVKHLITEAEDLMYIDKKENGHGR